MRVGLSWEMDGDAQISEIWKAALAEAEQADRLGYDSMWIREGRGTAADVSSATLFLTYASKRTQNLQLRSAQRTVTLTHPVRIAEEVAVLDIFSRGRAGVAFAAGSRQDTAPGHVHEVIEFVKSAWASDELRYRGEHFRFPTHTEDDAPPGVSHPKECSEYTPQWEWGPIMPDFLAVTPKPYTARPPVYVDIEDDETLDWAAKTGVAPLVGADVPTAEAVERLNRYRKQADQAGRSPREVEVVLERRIRLNEEGDECALGGSTQELIVAIRQLGLQAGVSHLIWRRNGGGPMDLFAFMGSVQLLLQA